MKGRLHRSLQGFLTALGAVAVLAWAAPAFAQGIGGYCFNRNENCDGACCGSSGPGGGPGQSSTGSIAGDPFNLAVGNTIYRTEDVHIRGSVAPLTLWRSFDSEPYDWNEPYALSTTGAEPPFGVSPSNPNSLNWVHDYFSFIYLDPTAPHVRAPGGYRFDLVNLCTTYPCWLQPHYQSETHRLLQTGASTFSLFDSGNTEFDYSLPYQAGEPLSFLTAIKKPSGVTTATLSYRTSPLGVNGQPLTTCSAASPYISTITNEDGAFLDLRYEIVAGSDLECVLAEILVGDGSGPEVVQTQYSYTVDGAGYPVLAGATISPGTGASLAQSYSYATGFTVQHGTGTVVNQVLGTTCNVVTSDSSPRESLAVTWGTQSGGCGAYNNGSSAESVGDRRLR
ncbi:MAG: hypothetical protein ACYCWW_15175 [Deltaproteobacteria bacterium]